MIVATYYGTHPGKLDLESDVSRVSVVTNWGYRVEVSEQGIKIWNSQNELITDFYGRFEEVDTRPASV